MNGGSIGFVGFGPPGLFGPVGRYASVEQHPLGIMRIRVDPSQGSSSQSQPSQNSSIPLVHVRHPSLSRHFTNLMNHMNFRFHRSQPFSFDPIEIDEMFPFTATSQRRRDSRSDNGTSTRALTSDEIRKIKTTKITSEHVADRKECYTCMEEFKLDERVLRIDCPHMFHKKCLEPWLKRQNSCPVCRAIIDPSHRI
ncbi:hypothetical protein L596_027033 [Steinernema carpocapsae]|uniref:RING-type domain-containing protein n=1 Tax=Steinernema carpocapsae TaxID=34508 RepID=A0A4U5M342_STECR|nr:hypothetical protein L596_027033 [Steinernema carpocapsae]